jgi:hypothetical protein
MFRTLSVHHQERFVQAVFADLVRGNTRTTRHVGLHIQISLYCNFCIYLYKNKQTNKQQSRNHVDNNLHDISTLYILFSRHNIIGNNQECIYV